MEDPPVGIGLSEQGFNCRVHMTVATPLLSDSDPTSYSRCPVEDKWRLDLGLDWEVARRAFIDRQGNLANSVVNSLLLLVALALCFNVWWKMRGGGVTLLLHNLLCSKWDEEVKEILEKVGLLAFIRKFFDFSESNSIQVTKSWDEGKVVKFVKAGKGKVPLHQALVKLLYQFAKDRGVVFQWMMRGGFPRSSGTPVSRAQLHLGAATLGKDSLSPASKPNVVLTKSENEEESPKKEVPKDLSKGGEARNLKRMPPPLVLASSLAKCSRRSSRLQQKSEEKHKIVDNVDSSEEDKGGSDNGQDAEMSKGLE
eukprot:Gb_40371 [translate_table: standard]